MNSIIIKQTFGSLKSLEVSAWPSGTNRPFDAISFPNRIYDDDKNLFFKVLSERKKGRKCFI